MNFHLIIISKQKTLFLFISVISTLKKKEKNPSFTFHYNNPKGKLICLRYLMIF